MGIRQFFRGQGRSDIRASKNLGIINLTDKKDPKKFRDDRLEMLDSYYELRQYGEKPAWDTFEGANGEYIPVRKRAPRFNFAYAKNLSQRVASKLLGKRVFPAFKVQDAPDDEALIQAVVREAKLKARLLEPIRRCLNTGSVFVRFYIEEAAYKVEWFHAKHCYPIFQGNGQLELLRVQYVYVDNADKDSLGRPKKKWFRMDLGMDSEILYDNPEYKPEEEEPIFQVVAEVDHGLGFVQGTWMRTCELPKSPDGYSLIEDVLGFIDEMNYSLSQSSQALAYNQDPQLLIKGMDEEEMDSLIKSSSKSWNMGREGEASYLEADLTGVQRAMELRDKIRVSISEISRVVLIDPEKAVGNAQSAKAMETLYEPLVELIEELREPIGDCVKELVLKMTISTLMAARQGIPVPIEMPPGFMPTSLQVDLEWPPIFQQTMEDLQRKVSVAASAKNGLMISPETAMRFVHKDFNVENLEEEMAKIDAEREKQAALNPYGGF